MKKLYIFSLLLNLAFIGLFGHILIKRGGLPYLKARFFTRPVLRMEKDKPWWYYKNYYYWHERKSLFDVFPNDTNAVIFLGNSITDGCEWHELFQDIRIKNRGIGGDNTEGVLERLDAITDSAPAQLFINIGINDIALSMPASEISRNYELILDRIRTESPGTEIFVQSVLPTADYPAMRNASVRTLNTALRNITAARRITFIDLYEAFSDQTGRLNPDYTYDGIHLNGPGYLHLKKLLLPYINTSGQTAPDKEGSH